MGFRFPIAPASADTSPGKSTLSAPDPIAPAAADTSPGIGKDTLTNPVGAGSATPGKRTLVSHTQPASMFRNPIDEAPADLLSMIHVAPPPEPYEVRNVVPWREQCPDAPESVRDQPMRHHAQDTSLLSPDRKRDPPVLITEFKVDQRQAAWNAYRDVAAQVMRRQMDVSPQLAWFSTADQAALEGTGLVLPKGFRGDIAGLADRQEVPRRGGQQVGTLFGADNRVKLSAADKHTLDHSDVGVLGITRVDSHLQATIARVKAAAERVSASAATLRACSSAVDMANAQYQSSLAESQLQQLQSHRSKLLATLNFMAGGPEQIAKILSNFLNPGAAVAMVFSVLPIEGLAEAQEWLKHSKQEFRDSQVTMLNEQLEAAKLNSLAAIQELAAQRLDLEAAMAERREAYDQVGMATGNRNVAAALSAIPVVEVVVGNARLIMQKTADAIPTLSHQAAVGFGIALRHGFVEAETLPDVVGMLQFVNLRYGELWMKWLARLKSLQAMKGQLMGERQGGNIFRGAVPLDSQ